MHAEFKLPENAVGRFAIVKLWPDIKTAEDECIARLKIAAKMLGVECVEVYSDGRLIESPEIKVSKKNVDFVIHLHYDTPKNYDAFSFVALWNPVRFYHEWGYSRCSRNLTSHDDFISCSSDAADDHVSRMIRNSSTHLSAQFHLYHSTADIVFPPSLGECKLFYAGINWEAISGGKSRHQEVLKRLDRTGLLSIYGPKFFQGVRVWEGYESYVREIPFDGTSMIEEISKAGLALVLSSSAHKDSGLMTNRLFESVAAGALVICDENPFARRYFGDSLLYVDGRAQADQIYTDIVQHLNWAKSHPERALDMIAQAQDIMSQKFTLKMHLRDLYLGLSARKQQLANLQNPSIKPHLQINLYLLMPEFSASILNAHIESVGVQEYQHFRPIIVIDKFDAEKFRVEIAGVLSLASAPIELLEVDFFNRVINANIKVRKRLGEIILQLISARSEADAIMIVAPNEKLFSNHLAVLAGALRRDSSINCAATGALLVSDDTIIRSVHELIDFGHVNRMGPPGYGRFIFRANAIPADVNTALPYLDGRPLAVLVGDHGVSQQLPASIVIDLRSDFPERTWDEVAENEIIRDYCPDAFALATGFGQRKAWPQLPVTSAGILSTSVLHLVLKRFNRHWVRAQIHALRTQGLPMRLQALRRRLSQ